MAAIAVAALWGCDPGDFDTLVGGSGGAGRDAEADHAPQGSGGMDGGSDPRPSAMDATSGQGGAGAGGTDGAMQVDGAMSIDAAADAAADGGGTGAVPDGGDGGCAHAADPARVRARANDLGIVPAPDSVSTRKGVGSAAIGNRIGWIFEVMPKSHMAAWTTRAELLSDDPRFDEQEPALSLLPGAIAPAGADFVISSVVALNPREMLLFVNTFQIFTTTGVGLALLRRNQLQAELVHPVNELFPPPPPDGMGMVPWHPIFNTGAVVETTDTGSFLYLYACQAKPDEPDETGPGIFGSPCRVARAPAGMATDGGAYRYWDGTGWNADRTRAVPAIRELGGAWSVTYNRYLGAFIGVASGLSNTMRLFWARRPEGPWHRLDQFDTLPGPGGNAFEVSNMGTEHPSLRDECEQVIYVSYVRDVDVSDNAGGTVRKSETRLVSVMLE